LWHQYRAGDWITCPGYSTGDRRAEDRGTDRRKSSRPCTYTFGRVQLGSRAWVRIVNRGELIEPPSSTLTQGCPSCRATVLLHVQAAEAA
jgi:hypothetical protein